MLEYMLVSYPLLIVLFFLGTIFGSFFNVLADRLSMGVSLNGRSKCESCGHTLAWNDLIPIVSYISLRGRCRYCAKPFSIQYVLTEIATGALFVLTWMLSVTYTVSTEAIIIHVVHVAIAGVLFVMFVADLRYQIIPDEMQIALFILGLTKIIFASTMISMGTYSQIAWDIGAHLVYGVAVMTPLFLVFLVTKMKGMGFGDVKLAFVIGFLLGLIPGFLALYIGFVLGGVVGTLILVFKKGTRKSKIAFGPFLILGLYIMLFFENDIILLVSKIYGF